MTRDQEKQAAAEAALGLIEPGMRLGLGTGSTAAKFIDALGTRVKQGLKVLCVPTSEATRAQAEALGIPLTTLDETPELDLTVDGADEIDRDLRLIKGGGGALLREKIVAAASKRMIAIADGSKLVDRLGRFPLAVEVTAFGHEATRRAIVDAIERLDMSGPIVLRTGAGGKPLATENGNLMYDCALGAILSPERLDEALAAIPGVVGHGLFIGLCSTAIVAETGKSEATTLLRSKLRFGGGRNVAMKIPPDEYESTIAFYRDTLKLPVEALAEGSHIVSYGPLRLWLDRESRVSQSEVWLEVETSSVGEAAGSLAAAGVVRCDAIEELPEGFRGFWVKNPAGIVHLVCEPGQGA